MSFGDFMANDVGPFLRKRGVWILIVLVVIGGAAVLMAHVTSGVNIFDDNSGNGQQPYVPAR